MTTTINTVHRCVEADCPYLGQASPRGCGCHIEPKDMLQGAAEMMLEALREGRRAIGNHFPPDDCYATGPITGDPIRDLVQCPACSFIALHEAAIARATGRPA